MRSKADIPAKLAKSYATFEDIPLKQAYDELMVASKKDYRNLWLRLKKIIDVLLLFIKAITRREKSQCWHY
jgi:hypothetical protein